MVFLQAAVRCRWWPFLPTGIKKSRAPNAPNAPNSVENMKMHFPAFGAFGDEHKCIILGLRRGVCCIILLPQNNFAATGDVKHQRLRCL